MLFNGFIVPARKNPLFSPDDDSESCQFKTLIEKSPCRKRYRTICFAGYLILRGLFYIML